MTKIAEYVLYFFFYSAVGWLCESIYCSIAAKKWINRGFLKGPMCPIYGTGGMVILICLSPLTKISDKLWVDLLLVFFVGMVVCDIVEFITSLIMEKLFNARWWDYSGKKFNIQGRICLTHTLYWGGASLIFLFLGHPYIGENLMNLIPEKYRIYVFFVVLFVFLIDLINTVRSALSFRDFSKKLQALSDKIASYAEAIYSPSDKRGSEPALSNAEEIQVTANDTKKQLKDLRTRFADFLSPGKLKLVTPKRYLLRSFPYLEKGVKEQLKLLEDLVDEIENKFTDKDEEMF